MARPLAETRDDVRIRIVESAARLMREGGAAAVTTRAVSERAGVQAPTIYRLFGDKDGLLDAVAEHVLATYVSSKVAAADAAADGGRDPVGALRVAWDRQVDFGLANPGVFALLVDPARTSPAADDGMRVLTERLRRIAAAGRLRVSETRATELVHAAGVGVILSLLATPPAHRDRTLADAMWETVADCILTGEVGGSAPDDPDSLSAAVRRTARLSDGESRLLEEWLRRD